MRRNIRLILIALFTACLLLPQVANASPSISVSAEHAVLLDANSGRVLFEKEAYESSLIASTTKIMTAIIAIESGKLSEEVKVSERATRTEGSSIYLTEGEKIPLIDLVYGLLLRSGNDSAVAIAEHVGGSVEGFTYLMNQKARWLGMQSSHFENPHGLDGESHYSSAYDLALLMAYAMKNETFRKVTGSEKFKSDNRSYPWQNKNKLLTSLYDPTTGGKTGFTKKAGRTLVSSAEKDGMELVAVTLNAPDDWKDHERMYEYGFENYETYQLQEEGFAVSNGNEYYLPTDIFYPLTEQEKEQMESVFHPTPSTQDPQLAGVRYFQIADQSLVQTAVWKDRPYRSFISEWSAYLKRITGVVPWST
ncbi:D-alanyl-D-alanine carboxypeptidase family protein [Halobacillus amylolyticus]|uniref:D-alanyl-D-alanine carboxypeptidase family protein n=1 Tax=Halobacillus amylolyticus TaxID=2932259 RepID=UPI0037C15C0C